MKIMTFNVRVDIPIVDENSWSNRMGKVAKVIHQENPMIIGLQEAKKGMISDLVCELPNYQWAGEPRRKDDEFSPILYRSDMVELLETGTFWLSETPFLEGSISWDSSYPRICTWGEFSLTENPNKRFRVFNTHLDHMSEEARTHGVRLIWDIINQLNNKKPLPSMLMGDLNDYPDSETVQFCEKKMQLINAFSIMDHEEHVRKTFHDFEGGDEGEPIDYIFVSPDVKLLEAQIIRSKINGLYPSDHYPLTLMVELLK
ncbi:endonuclease/exonuclease/phosphatase family protein [Neobacillus drentensis]|uniref:endonuclease/exonuclease/phosphatase family protein n=1 Tax=Neobacillus drentensis TaxID=220684 RepID=UPI003001BB9F